MYPNLFHNSVPLTFKKKNYNQYNIQEFTLNPLPGDILLFPSHLEHTVHRVNTKKDRYGIAFNCFAKGEIGYGSEQITL
jgi:ectoine hydroxylase-related dioxygenase (phytanoyl-CoA dioxygenase family)